MRYYLSLATALCVLIGVITLMVLGAFYSSSGSRYCPPIEIMHIMASPC